jgi:hypothetical protein
MLARIRIRQLANVPAPNKLFHTSALTAARPTYGSGRKIQRKFIDQYDAISALVAFILL